MKHLLCTVLAAAGIFIVFLTSNTGAETIRLAQYEVLPLTSQKLPGGGFGCRITKEALAFHNHSIEIHWYPLKRAITLVEKGDADISLGWRKSKAREKKVIFSDTPLVDTSVVFFYRKDKPFDWETLEDLYGLKIGYVIGGISATDAFLAAEKGGKLTVDRVPTEQQNIRKLLAGRIDVMVGSTLITPFNLKEILSPEERAQIIVHPKALLEARYYAIFSRQVSPHIIHAFNDGIEQLRKNGQYELRLSEALIRE